MRGRIVNNANDGKSPYAFRINGSNHHKIRFLLPRPGLLPKFAQLYIYDTNTELSNWMSAVRVSAHFGVRANIMGCNKYWIHLIHMLLYFEELAICYVTKERFLICQFKSSKQKTTGNILDLLRKRLLDYWWEGWNWALWILGCHYSENGLNLVEDGCDSSIIHVFTLPSFASVRHWRMESKRSKNDQLQLLEINGCNKGISCVSHLRSSRRCSY